MDIEVLRSICVKDVLVGKVNPKTHGITLSGRRSTNAKKDHDGYGNNLDCTYFCEIRSKS